VIAVGNQGGSRSATTFTGSSPLAAGYLPKSAGVVNFTEDKYMGVITLTELLQWRAAATLTFYH
jgi:hypothetical protein